MHFSVMKQECIENLNIKDNGIWNKVSDETLRELEKLEIRKI